MERRLLRDPGQRPVVVRPANLQGLTLEDDPVEGHGLRGLVHRAELEDKQQLETLETLGRRRDGGTHLQEGKVLVLVDLDGQDRVAGGLGQARQAHLRVEELGHGLLRRRRRDRSAAAGRPETRPETRLTSVSPKGMFPT